MEQNRWWHVAVAAIGITLTIVLPLDSQPLWRTVGAEITLWAFIASWFAIGRLARRNTTATVVFLTIVILTAGIGTGFSPSMAIMQTIAFPLIWVFTPGLRSALVGNFALALSVGVGFLFSIGTSEGALIQTASTVTISLGFSMAMGLWITRIWHLSDERRALIEELRAAEGQLERLHRDAGATSERERLAREIHDTIAQSLTGLVLLAQRAQRELAAGENGREALADQLALLESSARETLVETRSLVAATASNSLSDGGLTAALERLGERFTRETSIAVTVTATGSAVEDRDTEVVLLRCAQEGLANVRKHSAAGTASVRLAVTGDIASLTVKDDGVGFDTAAGSSGFGLSGLRERLTLVGGSLAVTSSGDGTQLVATLPLTIQNAPLDRLGTVGGSVEVPAPKRGPTPAPDPSPAVTFRNRSGAAQ